MDTPLKKQGKGGFSTGIFKVGEEGELFSFSFFWGGWWVVGWVGGALRIESSKVRRDLSPVGHPKVHR